MAGTSILTDGGIVQFASSLYGTDDDPMDATILRDGPLHGLLHAADSMAQVRVNYMSVNSTVAADQDLFETTETPGSVNDWVQLGGSPFGPWPLTMRADGSGYFARVRIAGFAQATPATITFRVILSPSRRLSASDIEESVDWIFEATTTSGTAAWLTGNTAGDLSSATYITVPPSQMQAWTRRTSVYDAVSSPADQHTVQQALVAAHVYAKTSNTARLPRLTALHIQEFVG